MSTLSHKGRRKVVRGCSDGALGRARGREVGVPPRRGTARRLHDHRSLPPGIVFNVAGFGSRYESLFPKARAYSDETLAAADAWVRRMEADLGGTEILPGLARGSILEG